MLVPTANHESCPSKCKLQTACLPPAVIIHMKLYNRFVHMNCSHLACYSKGAAVALKMRQVQQHAAILSLLQTYGTHEHEQSTESPFMNSMTGLSSSSLCILCSVCACSDSPRASSMLCFSSPAATHRKNLEIDDVWTKCIQCRYLK